MAMKDGCDPITSAKLALQLGATQLGHAQLGGPQVTQSLGVARGTVAFGTSRSGASVRLEIRVRERESDGFRMMDPHHWSGG